MAAGIIVGIILAAASASAGLIGSIMDDINGYQSAAQQQAYITQQYLLDEQRAKEEFEAAKKEANRNADKMEMQADLTDEAQDITEQTLSNDFNSAIDNLYLSQESDALNWNLQAMQNGSQEGASYAALAGSGVRAGSSLTEAVEMQSAVNESQLQFSEDAKRRSDNNNLAGILNQLAGNEFNIKQNRIGADWQREDALNLVNSYLEGGSNFNLYKIQKDKMLNEYNYNMLQLQKEKEKHSEWNAFWNGFIAFNSQGARGFQTGYNIGKSMYEGAGYKTGSDASTGKK